MDIEKLIETLRQRGVAYVRAYGRYCSICDEVVTALSTLQAENEKLRAELDDLKAKWDKYQPREHWETLNELCENLHDELEKVKQDRDSIEQDFRAFAKQWWEEDSGFPCRWCKFENSGVCEWKAKQPNEEKICAGRAFEWRGQEKD